MAFKTNLRNTNPIPLHFALAWHSKNCTPLSWEAVPPYLGLSQCNRKGNHTFHSGTRLVQLLYSTSAHRHTYNLKKEYQIFTSVHFESSRSLMNMNLEQEHKRCLLHHPHLSLWGCGTSLLVLLFNPSPKNDPLTLNFQRNKTYVLLGIIFKTTYTHANIFQFLSKTTSPDPHHHTVSCECLPD